MTDLRHLSTSLVEGEPEEQVIALLDRPDAPAAIAALDAPVIHRLVHDAGWEVAGDLVPHLTVEQLQTCFDLDCWSRHEFVPSRVSPWLAALVSGASDEVFRRDCREIDAEILALYFRDSLLVDVWGEERECPEAFLGEEHVESSPDGVYALVYRADDPTNALLRATIARLYEVDRVLAWTLLEAARWELASSMEAEALRWRTSRLEEWGFVEFDEAMQIYKPLDGARYRERLEAGEIGPKTAPAPTTNLPVLAAVLDEQRFYAARILARLDEAALQRAMGEFVALQNRATIADGIDAGDRADTHLVTERTTGYLSIGLEFLARADDERAEELVRTVPLRDIFRVGFTTVERLRDSMRRIRHRPTLTLLEGERFSLLRQSDAGLCEALSNVRPLYADADGTRALFTTQAQVDDAAKRLALIAFKQLWLFGQQRVEPAQLVQLAAAGRWRNSADELGFDLFFATAVAQVLLDEAPGVRPIAPTQLRELARRVATRAWEPDPLATFEPLVGPALEALGPPARMMTTWLDATLARLVDELAGVADPDPRLLGSLVVIGDD